MDIEFDDDDDDDGDADSSGYGRTNVEIEGEEHISVYRAKLEDGGESSGERSFCRHCGSALWLWDPRWPELVHPQASAIDSELPEPPLTVRAHVRHELARVDKTTDRVLLPPRGGPAQRMVELGHVLG